MMILMFAPLLRFIVEFIVTAISKKRYDEKFWLITLGYTPVYLFLWPALMGDAITILTTLYLV